MNVGELKKILENLPDETPVMVPGPAGDGGWLAASGIHVRPVVKHPSRRFYQTVAEPRGVRALIVLAGRR